MKETWRLIEHPALPGSYNMAVDFAIMKAVARGDSPPVVRIYRWLSPAVTIGYFQDIDEELNADECAADGVPIVRRITGGGAVLHEHEITYSICVPLSHRLAFGTVLESYRRLLDPVIDALAAFGIKSEYQPVNDITAGGRKISGSAQTRREGVLLQHGTLLLDVNMEKMFRYLKVSGEKLAGRDIADAKSRVTSIRAFLGTTAAEETFIIELRGALVKAFRDGFSVALPPSVISQREEAEALQLRERIFENPEWNRSRAIKP